MSKKNIDKLFQEKFKDFEEVPDEKVWNAIENSLDRKKKNRIIPLWWKLGGAAAVLAIALIAFNPFATTVDKVNPLTDTEKVSDEKLDMESNPQDNIRDFPNANENAVVAGSEEEPSSNQRQNQEAQGEDLSPNDNKANSSTIFSSGNRSNNRGTNDSEDTQVTTTEAEKEDGIATTENPVNAKNIIDSNQEKQNEDIAITEKSEGHTNTESEFDITNDAGIAQKENGQKDTIDINDKETLIPTPEESLAQNAENPNEVNEADPKKKSILDAIQEQNKEEVVAEKLNGRWSAGPSVAPVYFNGMGTGSPVHSLFTQNSKSGNTNLSYGLSVAYQVTSKLRVRSGVHRVDYGYDTDGVEFSSTLQASTNQQLKNIDYTPTAKNLVVKSQANTFSNLELASNNFALDASTANSASRDGVMAQEFGYLEVPLELDYALIDRKFGVNLVGGVSSLFLLNNSVTLTSGELTTEIGEANNINNVNFSTNIGFGLNYKFTPSIRLNVEPVFKYQLNTFSNVSGDFQPFTVGVYSGLNFRF
ncbi:MAG: outer membrane beta-barrel protein [Pricia sp.]|nr:outer membrane beta-barrel protein [Pricia sp.]